MDVLEQPSDDSSGSNQLNCSTMESLEDLDWDGLLEVCKVKDEKLNMAGEYGLKLHDELLATQAHIDEMRLQHEADIEKYIQESYELKTRLDLKEKSFISLQQEFDTFQKQVTKINEHEIEEIQNKLRKEISVIKKEKCSLFSDLEQAQLKERHANDKVTRLEEKIQEIQLENQRKGTVSAEITSAGAELFELNEKICVIEEELEQKELKLTALQNENQSLSLELQNKNSENNSLKKELEEVEMRSTSYFNHLQQSREEVNETKAELDMLNAQIRGSGHLTQGNSLFGEVEDKRAEMEKKLLSMQVKYESLQKAYTFAKSQLHNMKTQVIALLQMNSGRADGERISNLERALSQARSEKSALYKKLHEAENSQNLSTEGIQALSKRLPHFESNKDMVNFLSIQLKDYKEKESKLRAELDQTEMLKLAETDKLQTAETKLHETAVLAEKYKNQNMQLRLKLEETNGKLQAETQKRILVEKKFNYDSTGDVVPLGALPEEGNRTKKTLPYTLAKAKEMEKEKQLSQNLQWNQQWNLSSSMNWSDLNMNTTQSTVSSTMADKIQKKPSLFQKVGCPSMAQKRAPLTTVQDALSFKTPVAESGKRFCQDVDDKPRKVSFKEEPETIRPKAIADDDESSINEMKENRATGKSIPVDTESVFDNTLLEDTIASATKVASSAKKSPIKLSAQKSQTIGSVSVVESNNAECKMQ